MFASSVDSLKYAMGLRPWISQQVHATAYVAHSVVQSDVMHPGEQSVEVEPAGPALYKQACGNERK